MIPRILATAHTHIIAHTVGHGTFQDNVEVYNCSAMVKKIYMMYISLLFML